MTSEDRPPPLPAARETTDEKLSVERARADEELQQKLDAPTADADAELERSRDATDRELARVSQEATRKVQRGAREPGAAAAALEDQRAEVEETIAEERAETDEALSRERLEQRRLVAQLLADERADTDDALSTERHVSDRLVHDRDELLALVSHDIRNLVSAMALRLRALRRTLEGDGDAAGRGLVLVGHVERAAAVIHGWAADLVDLSRLEDGSLRVHPEAGDLAAIVEETVGYFGSQADDRGVALEAQVERPLSAWVDAPRVVQVISNLLHNALKFTPDGGRIEVGARRLDGHVRVEVRDTGPGIPEKDRPHVFDRTWRRGPLPAAGGLGLFICRRIIEMHGGEIGFELEPGPRTTFWFTLRAA